MSSMKVKRVVITIEVDDEDNGALIVAALEKLEEDGELDFPFNTSITVEAENRKGGVR